MAIDRELLDILACPESRAPLVEIETAEGHWLVSTDPATRRRYPVRDGLPVLLIDESEVLDEDVWAALVGKRS